MLYQIQLSQSAKPLLFRMVDSSDHVTPKTGLTPTVTISKNGAAFGAPSGAVTELANGWYKVAGHATDSNTLGPLILHATSAGADPADEVYQVVGFNPDTNTSSNITAIKAKTDLLVFDTGDLVIGVVDESKVITTP